VTVAIEAMNFRMAVYVGDLVSFHANLVRIGRTSVTVAVEVYAQRNPDDLVTVKVTEASLTYVATGADRRPREVPPK
jgi:acyl-CoA thioesterase YciA